LDYISRIFLDLSSEVKRKVDSHGSVNEDARVQLEMLSSFVENLSRGEIPEPITDSYNSALEKMKKNINNCIEELQGLVECNNVLNRMAVNDHTKSVEGEFVGIYASMSKATNLVRDRVLNVTNVLENIAIGNTSRLEN
jgi:methyl-accepting chemotaxis protein